MTTSMFFPLGTGLEPVPSGRLDAGRRARQAAILFDEIVVEAGMQQVDVREGDNMPMERYFAAEGLSVAVIERQRVVEAGTTAGLALHRAGDEIELLVGSGLPRIDGALYLEGVITQRYLAEFHSSVLDPLTALAPEWLRAVAVNRSDRENASIIESAAVKALPATSDHDDRQMLRFTLDHDEAEQLSEELSKQLSDQDTAQPEPPPGDPLRTILGPHFSEAAELADHLDATFNVTDVYAALALERGVAPAIVGEESLRIFIPNVSSLPWEAICEFREHPAAAEARERLRAFEERALSEGLPGSADFIRSTATEVTGCLVAATRDLAPNLPENLARPVAETAVGVIPVVGQYLSLASSVADMIAAVKQHHAYSESWLAAIFELREEALASLVR
jgi:hypothetical protein